jgi:hypothetical protein
LSSEKDFEDVVSRKNRVLQSRSYAGDRERSGDG